MRSRSFLAALSAILVAAAALPLLHGRPAAAHEDAVVEGRITVMASSVSASPGRPPSEPTLSLLIATENGRVTVDVAPDADVTDAEGRGFDPYQLQPADVVRADGEWQTETRLLAYRLIVLNR